MINKFQQGGQASQQQQQILMQAAQVLQQAGYNIVDNQGNLDQQAFIQAVAQYGQEKLGVQVSQENIGQVITAIAQQGAQMARRGAKLNYLKKIANNCPEGTQLTYFKAGGQICSKCEAIAKKEQTGGVMDNIKKEMMLNGGKAKSVKNKTTINPNDTVHIKNPATKKMEVRDLSGKHKQFKPLTKSEYQRQSDSKKTDIDLKGYKNGGKPTKDCGGSKLLAKKGIKAKACPKCGKVHTGKCGAKMKKHQIGGIITAMQKLQNGGSLNGVPFMQEGTTKGGLPTAPKAEDRYKNGRRSQLPYYKEVWTPTNRNTLTQGASIRQYINPINPYYNDTTYIEIPEHTSFVKLAPRIASTNSKEDLNSPILDKNGWPTGYYKFKFNNSPEYEILKRRFNTAWNIAK